jgi:hypothetical protein
MYTAKGQLDRNDLIKQYQPLVRRLDSGWTDGLVRGLDPV